MFVVLEGIDGCGKSTQARRLVDELKRRGREVIHVHEPGGTSLGEALREIILKPAANVEIHSRTEALLYSAARAELVDSVLAPALARGAAIVCERYYYSTLAYQGYGLEQDTGALHALSAYATARMKPDRVVLLDIDARAGLARVGRALDRIESRGADYLSKVREGYHLLARREPERFRLVDAAGTPDEVSAAVMKTLADVLS